MGAGAFGRVVKAEAVGILESEAKTTVAVKMIKSLVEPFRSMGLKSLLDELKIMVHMGSHLNVVNLLGACTLNTPIGTAQTITALLILAYHHLIKNTS